MQFNMYGKIMCARKNSQTLTSIKCLFDIFNAWRDVIY